jgi:hypothetical protein
MTPLGSRNITEDPALYGVPDARVSPMSSLLKKEDLGDEDYAKALELSREDLSETSQYCYLSGVDHLLMSSPDKNLEKHRTNPRPDPKIQAMLSLSNVFRPLLDPGADTLIYIGPPPRAPGQSETDYLYIEQVFSVPHRVRSQVLKDLDSTAFDRLLGPKSERTRRRFGKERILTGSIAEGIKYYIDLRPAEEGDEAVELITDLTCTQGILNWYKAKAKYSIAPTIVCGRDDFVSPLDQFRAAERQQEDDTNEIEPLVMPEAEYSALRHRSAIERVIQAIGHNDPKLDSAPKMWTYFQVAKHLDVAKHERVSGWITKWLYSHPNSNFVQSNPEVVYRIGMGIMSTNMICDAYSMLAGEKALLDTSDPTPRSSSGKSVHGRPLEILDDDERNRVDHAAASLHARVNLRFAHLIDESMDWLKTSNEYGKLMALEPRNDVEKEVITTTDQMIKDYVRGRILWVMGRNYLSDHFEFDQAMVSCRDFRDDLPLYFNEVYGKLNEAQRLLTRTLWIALQAERIEEGECNAYTPTKGSTGVLYLQSVNAHNYNYCQIGNEMIAREDRAPGTGVKIMTRNDLSTNIGKVNRICKDHFVGDKKVNLTTKKEKPNKQTVTSYWRGQPSDMPDPQIESGAAQSKHDLIELDSEDEAPLEMTNRTRAQSGSEKRRRLSSDELAVNSSHTCPQESILPLRERMPDLLDDKIGVSRGEDITDDIFQCAHPALVPGQKSTMFTEFAPKSSHGSGKLYELSASSSDAEKHEFDTYARFIAETTEADTWESADGDIYVHAEPFHFKQLTEGTSQSLVWVATPAPFSSLETTMIMEKKYWRATTCQLFCKLPDGSINLVHEDYATIPTLAETSSRILDDAHLRDYVLAYDAYARSLAETLALPYWTALSGDMYLRSPRKPVHDDANVWKLASDNFNGSTHIDVRCEGNNKIEYWRSLAGHLFRRRAGRIELYTTNKEESPPFNAASILAAPLKMVTESGMHKIAPHANFLSKGYSDVERSMQPQSPPRRRMAFSTSHPEPVPPGSAEISYPCIILKTMLLEFSGILSNLCEDILHPPHIYHGTDPIPRNLMDTLMCLTDDEWKYLPLWAGGCDDGTGGVFDEASVPNLEAGGFAGGKRGLGSDAVDGKSESDEWSEVGSEAISTVGRASRLATDGTETVKSFESASTQGFMRQDDIYRAIQNMNVARQESAAARNEDGDQVTVRDAASDIQGELFGDIDDDKEVEGMDEDEEDDGFEVIDGDDDAFVPVAKN